MHRLAGVLQLCGARVVNHSNSLVKMQKKKFALTKSAEWFSLFGSTDQVVRPHNLTEDGMKNPDDVLRGSTGYVRRVPVAIHMIWGVDQY